MHHKSWSNLRKLLEEDRLCPALRGRVQYFMTRYHDAHDDYGRFCIRVDGKEYLNAYYCSDYVPYLTGTGQREFRRISHEECLEQGLFKVYEAGWALDKYMDALTIDDALSAENPLIRLFAVLDRRVGKRRLSQLAAAMKNEPEWLQFFYWLRLHAEGVETKEEFIHAKSPHHLPQRRDLLRQDLHRRGGLSAGGLPSAEHRPG